MTMTLQWRRRQEMLHRTIGHPPEHSLLEPPESCEVQSDDAVVIRLANNGFKRNSASMLLNRMYAWRGYGSNHRLSNAPTHTSFTASRRTDIVGTITLAVDSAAGLSADATFKDEIDRYRNVPGAMLCELTKFAFEASSPSKPLLASVFHLVFIYGYRKYQCTDLFIEVNPRHVRFYEAMLGFKKIGDIKLNAAVDALSQLMCLKVSSIRDHINQFAGSGENSECRSLYPFFFSPAEEDAIFDRLITDGAKVKFE